MATMKDLTHGDTVKIWFHQDADPVIFQAGGTLRCERDEIGVMVNGQIRFADGDEAWALLVITEEDAGEVWDWGVFLPGGGVAFRSDYSDQDPPSESEMKRRASLGASDPVGPPSEFYRLLGKTKDQIWPLDYRYDAVLKIAHDPHIGMDGWMVKGQNDFDQTVASRYAEMLPTFHSLRAMIASDPLEQPERQQQGGDDQDHSQEQRYVIDSVTLLINHSQRTARTDKASVCFTSPADWFLFTGLLNRDTPWQHRDACDAYCTYANTDTDPEGFYRYWSHLNQAIGKLGIYAANTRSIGYKLQPLAAKSKQAKRQRKKPANLTRN
jgi:hypothetical protein